MIAHGAAEDEKHAAELAIKAGVDIEMMTTCYTDNLKELIAEGTVEEALVDEAVLRILTLKMSWGYLKIHTAALMKPLKQPLFCLKNTERSPAISQRNQWYC